jgi:hypothetical protein
LIEALVADTGQVPARAMPRRLGAAALCGGLVALALVLAWLKPRPDLAQALGGGFFWIKAAYTALLGAAGFLATWRLAQPGVSARMATLAALALVAAFEAVAVAQFMALDPHGRMAAMRGASWTDCSRNIVVLAAPMLAATLWALRGLAPTRPAAAGFAAGAFASGLAATIYGLHCAEATFVFVGLWYTLGLLASGALGALAGRYVLRW